MQSNAARMCFAPTSHIMFFKQSKSLGVWRQKMAATQIMSILQGTMPNKRKRPPSIALDLSVRNKIYKLILRFFASLETFKSKQTRHGYNCLSIMNWVHSLKHSALTIATSPTPGLPANPNRPSANGLKGPERLDRRHLRERTWWDHVRSQLQVL